jgi:hypothetical protein
MRTAFRLFLRRKGKRKGAINVKLTSIR